MGTSPSATQLHFQHSQVSGPRAASPEEQFPTQSMIQSSLGPVWLALLDLSGSPAERDCGSVQLIICTFLPRSTGRAAPWAASWPRSRLQLGL